MKHKLKTFLSALLAVAMLLSLLPAAVFAADNTGTFQKITAQDQLTDGQYVMVVDSGYAVGALDGTWLTATQLTDDNGAITDPAANLVWTVSVTADGVTLTDGNGVTVAPKGGNNNGIQSGAYTWAVTFANGAFRFLGVGEDTVTLASNKSSENKFRAYKNTTINAGYPCDFTLYKLEGEAQPSAPTLVETPQNGDVVVIYYPTDKKIMGTESYTYNEKKDELAAVDAVFTEDVLTVPEGAAEFKVYVDENGHYTFQSDAGYLYLDGTHVRLVPEQGDYTLFDLEAQETGSFIKSTNAQYSGKPQYLEYYGGYFTCYGMGSNADIYTFQFYKTGTFDAGEEPAPTPGDGPIYDGEQVVIYNPAYGKALSGTYNGYYNNGTDVTLTGNTLSGFSASDVWTVIDNGDGTWSFSYGGQKIGMDTQYTSMPLGGVNDQWVLEDAGDGLFYVKNTVRGAYMEYQDSYGTWSAYHTISSGSEGLFALAFYQVTEIPEEPGGDLTFPDTFVIYNVSAAGVLAGQDDNQSSPSVNSAAATVADGVATPANGARVFTVEQNGEYYRFKTSDGYLCSNGTGNNAFYSAEASEEADWTLTAFNGGYNLKSRTAKYNSSAQYLEYYGGSYKTYSLYNDSDKDIYTFNFYPLAEGVTVTDGVVNVPSVVFGALSDAYVGQDYTVTFTVDSVFGVAELSARYGETFAELSEDNGVYSFTIPAADLTEGTLSITVTGADTKNVTFSGTADVAVKDEPVISGVFPAANAQTGDEKRPEIGFTFGNAGENPTVAMSINGTAVSPTVTDGKASYTPAADLADGKTTVSVTLTRADGKSVSRSWSFTIGVAEFQLYFGQLHSHTAEYSDGAGTLQEGLNYVANLPESANVDFVAFTDHSNYFDSSSEANPEAALYDTTQMSEQSTQKWNAYKGAVAAFNAAHAGEIVALAGFEMTWSGGPGHINTFNTPGIVSRNNATLNSKTGDAGLQAYYALLSNAELVDSISQFNHPGTTFGNFIDFGYYDPIIDTRIYLVEVGNGEGAIGQGGYYPSYEQYIMALDKGWHVAPTNNQDNHKGKWGNANDARNVILTDDFSEQGLYEAIRNYRVYATEDKNLEINYTLNGQMMGAIIDEVPETAAISVSVYDPDSTDSIAKVEVVVNSGAVAYTWDDPTELASGELSCTIPASYSYYFIRVTQGDGDLAVTAPVWVGEVVKLGISSVECGTSIPVTGEELTLSTTLFNSESSDATVTSITYTSGGQVLYTDATGYDLPASSTAVVDWQYTPDMARVMTVTITAVVEQDGISYTYSKDITLDILDASQLVYIGIDASHYNEYVAGNYKDSMGNFSSLAAGYSVRTVELKTSEDLIAACENAEGKYKAIILTAPSRRLADAQNDPRTYSQAELDALTAFNAAGGVIILSGWSDYYENYSVITGNPDIVHMAATQNAILEALGSSLRIADDTASDDVLNGGDSNRRLYLSTYNFDNFLMDGVEFDPANPNDNFYSQLYSHYGGATVYTVDADGNPTSVLPATVSPVVYGHASTYSKDNDNDGLGGDNVPTYAVAEGDSRLMVLASEQLEGKGLIIVSGAAFMSNFEVQSQPDSAAEKNYSNYTICENLVSYLNPVSITPIAEVQAQELEGIKYTIEGVVTSNASGYDKDTAFFDCIYVQDETAGVNAFPVAGNYKIGDVVRITGTTSSYQGERQIAVTSIEKIGETDAPAPKEITAAQLNDGSVLGSLVTLKGTVVSFQEENGSIQTILVRDSEGNIGRVFIDGYITSDKEIDGLEVGCAITATGLASYDNTFNAPEGPFPRIRVRDRADIVCGEGGTTTVITGHEGPRHDVEEELPDEDTPLAPGVFTDLDQDAWYYDDVMAVIEAELMNGVSSTSFAPEMTVSRAMAATILYRLSGETYSGSSPFPDVAEDTWYTEAVAWANHKGIITGYDTGIFAPNDNVTREQLAAMFYRYQQAMEGDTAQEGDLSVFTDGDAISSYAVEAMTWAVGAGLIQGRSDSLLAPAGITQRCELCAILVRFEALNG